MIADLESALKTALKPLVNVCIYAFVGIDFVLLELFKLTSHAPEYHSATP